MYRVKKQCAIIHWLLNSPALECEFARGARSQDKSVRVAAVPTAGHAPVACDTAPAARRASFRAAYLNHHGENNTYATVTCPPSIQFLNREDVDDTAPET